MMSRGAESHLCAAWSPSAVGALLLYEASLTGLSTEEEEEEVEGVRTERGSAEWRSPGVKKQQKTGDY